MFADDLLLLSRADPTSIKLIFEAFIKFSQASGLEANLDKSEVYFGGVVEEEQVKMQQLLGVSRGSIPFKYLGAPLASKKLTIAQCKPLVDRVTARIHSWTNRKLSYAERVQMIKSLLFRIQTYWSQIFILPKKIFWEIETIFRVYLWTDTAEKSKKALVAWSQVCLPKVNGGWNILSLTEWNKAAVCRSLWDLAHKADSLWVSWVHVFYFKKSNWWDTCNLKKCSWTLSKILKCRDIINQLGGWRSIMQNGKFKIALMYKALRPQGEKVSWKRTICNNKASSKSIFIVWLAVQHRLATRDRLTNWKIKCNPMCVLCEKEPETMKHLFFECDYGAAIWQAITDLLKVNLPNDFQILQQIVEKGSRKKNSKEQLIPMLFAEAVYGVWRERNNKVFNNVCKPTNILYRQISL